MSNQQFKFKTKKTLVSVVCRKLSLLYSILSSLLYFSWVIRRVRIQYRSVNGPEFASEYTAGAD
jgi:hypothetical protein